VKRPLEKHTVVIRRRYVVSERTEVEIEAASLAAAGREALARVEADPDAYKWNDSDRVYDERYVVEEVR